MDLLRLFGKNEEPGVLSERAKLEEKRLEKRLSTNGIKWLKPRMSSTVDPPQHRLSHVNYFRNWFKSVQDEPTEGKDFLECMIASLEKVSTSIPKNLRRLDMRKVPSHTDASEDTPRLSSPSFPGRLHPAEVKFINENYPYPADSKVANKLPLPTHEQFNLSPKSLPASGTLSPHSPVPGLEVFQRIYGQTKVPVAFLRTPEKPKINEIALKLHWTLRDTAGNRPESREGACLCVAGQRLFLFGGLSMAKRNDTRVLDTTTWCWTQLSTLYTPKGRIGHTVVYFRKQLLVFGGWSNYSQRLGVRRCYKKIYSLFLEGEPRWQRFRGIGKVPKSRRYHCAAVFGASMLMYGGVDTQCKVLKGINVLMMDTLEWTKPKINGKEMPGARCNSSLTPVFHSNLLQRDDFTLFTISKQRIDQYMPNSGFYLFGGIDQDGAVHNDLWVLSIVEGGLTWKLAETIGVQPTARSDHSSVFLNGYLILFGGRNDGLYNSRGDSSIRDLSLLNLTSMRWESFKIQGSLPPGRWGHCATTLGTRMIILGGISAKEFLPSDVFVLETDQFVVKDLIQMESDRKKIRRDGVFE